jgi:hypothetical protein
VALPDQPAYSSGSDAEDSEESDDDYAFNPRSQRTYSRTQEPQPSPGSNLSSIKLAPPPGAELAQKDFVGDFNGLSIATAPVTGECFFVVCVCVCACVCA